jgi:hypothetical protein
VNHIIYTRVGVALLITDFLLLHSSENTIMGDTCLASTQFIQYG